MNERDDETDAPERLAGRPGADDGANAARAGEGGIDARTARFSIGDAVRHRLFPFRGVIFDVDPEFANTEEWYEAIPAEIRPARDQPFYSLFAENDETSYVAYVSEGNLLPDESGEPHSHPEIGKHFRRDEDGRLVPREAMAH